MADYYPLIAKAVAGLEKSTGETRRALYERARTALVTQLRSMTPALSESDITRERLALEEAVRKVEAETARRARFETLPSRAEKPPAAAPPPPVASAIPAAGELPATETTQPKGRERERPMGSKTAPSSRSERPLLGERPSLSDAGLKGFRDVVAEAETLGEATSQAAKSARETFAAVPAPGPEFERSEPRVEPEGLRPPERRRASARGTAVNFDRGAKNEVRSSPEERPFRPQAHDYESADITGRPLPRPAHPEDLRPRSRSPQIEDEDVGEQPPPRSYGRLTVIAVLVLLVLGLGGLGYWQWPTIAGMVNSATTLLGPTSTPSRETTPSSRPKISDRLGSQQVPGSQEGAAVAQRVVLYEEDSADPAGKRYVGSAVWRAEKVAAAPGQAPELVVRAEIDIPERKAAIKWSLRRNTDKGLPASHTVEIMFTLPADFPHGGIANIPGLLMKQAEQTRGVPLAGSAVKVTDGFFLIGLSAVESDMQRNIQLMKERAWFDIPLVYTDGRRAIIAVEKGTPGERAFADAFAAWGQ